MEILCTPQHWMEISLITHTHTLTHENSSAQIVYVHPCFVRECYRCYNLFVCNQHKRKHAAAAGHSLSCFFSLSLFLFFLVEVCTHSFTFAIALRGERETRRPVKCAGASSLSLYGLTSNRGAGVVVGPTFRPTVCVCIWRRANRWCECVCVCVFVGMKREMQLCKDRFHRPLTLLYTGTNTRLHILTLALSLSVFERMSAVRSTTLQPSQ